MPTYSLVIGLYPTVTETASNFVANYLAGLRITAYAVTYQDPYPNAPTSTLMGTARRLPTPANRVYQLFSGVTPQAAAAAVIRIPAAVANQYITPVGDPHTTVDDPLLNVVLTVERSGRRILDDSTNYDVGVRTGAGPLSSLAGVTVGLYLGLTAAGTEIGNSPYLTLPADGTPPSYSDLDTAISWVVQADPGIGGGFDPKNLNAPQCLHIAREIISNRKVNPLPAPVPQGGPPPDLGELFTTAPGDPQATARQQFLSTLQGYYANLSGEASRLAGYVYAWSAAQNCADITTNATSVGFNFPVRLATTPDPGQVAQATVALT